jgi:hypothetical protein
MPEEPKISKEEKEELKNLKDYDQLFNDCYLNSQLLIFESTFGLFVLKDKLFKRLLNKSTNYLPFLML